MDNENFDKVFLTDMESYQLDKAGSFGKVVIPTKPQHLLSLGFLDQRNATHKNEYLITSKGYRYLEYQRKKLEKETKDEKSKSFQFWFSLLITNLISLAALIVSIIALTKK